MEESAVKENTTEPDSTFDFNHFGKGKNLPEDHSDREVFDPYEPVTLHLEKGLNHGSRQITQMVFQPLNAGHMRKFPVGEEAEWENLMQLASYSSGVPLPVIFKMKGPDVGRLIKIAGALLGSFQ